MPAELPEDELEELLEELDDELEELDEEELDEDEEPVSKPSQPMARSLTCTSSIYMVRACELLAYCSIPRFRRAKYAGAFQVSFWS